MQDAATCRRRHGRISGAAVRVGDEREARSAGRRAGVGSTGSGSGVGCRVSGVSRRVRVRQGSAHGSTVTAGRSGRRERRWLGRRRVASGAVRVSRAGFGSALLGGGAAGGSLTTLGRHAPPTGTPRSGGQAPRRQDQTLPRHPEGGPATRGPAARTSGSPDPEPAWGTIRAGGVRFSRSADGRPLWCRPDGVCTRQARVLACPGAVPTPTRDPCPDRTGNDERQVSPPAVHPASNPC